MTSVPETDRVGQFRRAMPPKRGPVWTARPA